MSLSWTADILPAYRRQAVRDLAEKRFHCAPNLLTALRVVAGKMTAFPEYLSGQLAVGLDKSIYSLAGRETTKHAKGAKRHWFSWVVILSN